jgi:hypothetical protein
VGRGKSMVRIRLGPGGRRLGEVKIRAGDVTGAFVAFLQTAFISVITELSSGLAEDSAEVALNVLTSRLILIPLQLSRCASRADLRLCLSLLV